jgi:hypothetical protein
VSNDPEESIVGTIAFDAALMDSTNSEKPVVFSALLNPLKGEISSTPDKPDHKDKWSC